MTEFPSFYIAKQYEPLFIILSAPVVVYLRLCQVLLHRSGCPPHREVAAVVSISNQLQGGGVKVQGSLNTSSWALFRSAARECTPTTRGRKPRNKRTWHPGNRGSHRRGGGTVQNDGAGRPAWMAAPKAQRQPVLGGAPSMHGLAAGRRGRRAVPCPRPPGKHRTAINTISK